MDVKIKSNGQEFEANLPISMSGKEVEIEAGKSIRIKIESGETVSIELKPPVSLVLPKESKVCSSEPFRLKLEAVEAIAERPAKMPEIPGGASLVGTVGEFTIFEDEFSFFLASPASGKVTSIDKKLAREVLERFGGQTIGREKLLSIAGSSTKAWTLKKALIAKYGAVPRGKKLCVPRAREKETIEPRGEPDLVKESNIRKRIKELKIEKDID